MAIEYTIDVKELVHRAVTSEWPEWAKHLDEEWVPPEGWAFEKPPADHQPPRNREELEGREKTIRLTVLLLTELAAAAAEDQLAAALREAAAILWRVYLDAVTERSRPPLKEGYL